MMGYGYGWGMGTSGIVWMLLVGALIVVPFWRLLPQYRIPAWVAIFTIFPLIALILLWVMAFMQREGPTHPDGGV